MIVHALNVMVMKRLNQSHAQRRVEIAAGMARAAAVMSAPRLRSTHPSFVTQSTASTWN